MRKQLREHILSLSHSELLKQAIAEWDLVKIYHETVSQQCPCGQYPINEICEIENRITGSKTKVGNKCVSNFMNLPSDKLFKSVRNVRQNIGRSFSEELIDYAQRHGFINAWEFKFYANVRNDRSLSTKQRAMKESVNNKILSRIMR